MFFRCAFSRVLGVLFATALINLTFFSDGAFAQVGGEVNSINDGHNISAGSYFNTSGSRTIFVNTPGCHLWLRPGDTIRGLETSSTGTAPYGGLNFTAPGNVVRIDGNIDVSAIRNHTVYVGNGGRIVNENAFIYQNGTIFATGTHGHHTGYTQFNVSSFTLGPAGTHLGQIHNGMAQLGSNMASNGIASAQTGSVVDMNGKVIGKYDPGLIAIKGGLINLDGISIANGVKKQDGPGIGAVALLAHEPSNVAENNALSDNSQGEELRSNLVAGKALLKLGDRQWLSLGADTAVKAH